MCPPNSDKVGRAELAIRLSLEGGQKANHFPAEAGAADGTREVSVPYA